MSSEQAVAPRIRHCPLCDSDKSQTVLKLSPTPLGDRFCDSEEEARELQYYDLQVVRCRGCAHCYVSNETSLEESYPHYLFQSAASPGLSDAFEEIVADIAVRHDLCGEDFVIDIGANDGSWLSYLAHYGCELLAVEPAPMPAAAAKSRGLNVINDYFSAPKLAASPYVNRPPRLVFLNNVLANIANPINVLMDILSLGDDRTTISIITGYHPAQLAVGMFDYVYHEHISYFTGHDFLQIARQTGCIVTHCREIPIKGGSIHLELSPAASGKKQSSLFHSLLKREAWLDCPDNKQWHYATELLDRTRTDVKTSIAEARACGRVIIGYGASHSTTTLSYSLGIESLLDFIVDDNTAKHELFSPGAALPVKNSRVIHDYKSPFLIILSWQHGPKILSSLKSRGFEGTVAIPLPQLCIQEFA